MRSLAIAACALFAIGATSRTARGADRTAALAAHLDADAAAAVRIDLEHWENLVEAYKVSGAPDAGRNVFVASMAATALFGFDPLVRAGWFNAGFDADQPILATVARFGKGWRLRAVLAVDDGGRADATLARIARAAPGLHPVSKAHATALGRALGARDGRALVAELSRRGVRAAGQVPELGIEVALARRGDVVLIDVTHRAEVRAAVATAPRGLATASGAARRLRDPGQVLWLHGERAYDEAARYLAATGVKTTPACTGFREIVSAGPFVDVALSSEVRIRTGKKVSYSTTVKLAATWGLRGQFKLAAAFLLADDQLGDPRSLVDHEGAAAAGAIYLRSLAPLRALPRPKAMTTTRRELMWGLAACAPLAPATAWLMGWPQIAGLLIDQLARVNGDAEKVVAGARNALFAVRIPSIHRDKIMGFAEASVEASLAPQVEGYFDSLFGPRRRDTTSRPFTSWGKGRLRPYRWDTPGKRPVLGGALPNKAVRWRMSRTLPIQAKGRLVAELHLDPRRLVPALAAELPWLDPLRAVAGRMSLLGFQTQFDRDTLESFAVVDLR